MKAELILWPVSSRLDTVETSLETQFPCDHILFYTVTINDDASIITLILNPNPVGPKVGREEWGYGLEGYKYSTFKNLDDKWLEEGKVRMAINPDETREWAKGCKRVYFDNITVEEMLESFCDLSKELHTTRAEYISSNY